MRKICCIVLLVMIWSIPVDAQQKDSTNKSIKAGVQTVFNIGLSNGSKGASLAFQAISGISVYQSFAGIGIGIDYYRFRSIPLFLDIRHQFGKGQRHPFLYGDIGYNFDWLTDKNRSMDQMFIKNNYNGGVYYEGGAGYVFGFKKSDAILVSVAYSYKNIQNVTGTGSCTFAGPCYNDFQKYRYSMPRWMLKAGWRF